MKVKRIIDEDFNNYRFPAMFIGMCYCDFKCCKEANIPIATCQNEYINQEPNIEISADEIFRRYSQNPITVAVVLGGLEPMLQFDEVMELLRYFRERCCNDAFVIYTGYYPHEIESQLSELKKYPNVIVKFGRYKSNHKSHYDPVLGVDLISDNQYAVKIS